MTIEPYEFNPDLSRASTPPSSWYLDPAVLVREKEKIFGATWQLVGHTDQVRQGGDYFTCTVSDARTTAGPTAWTARFSPHTSSKE